MATIENAPRTTVSVETTTQHVSHDNITPLMVLAGVCLIIAFSCLCLTAFNSYMRKRERRRHSHISYGASEREHLKFGSLFRTLLPWWRHKPDNSNDNSTQRYSESRRPTAIPAETTQLLSNPPSYHYRSDDSEKPPASKQNAASTSSSPKSPSDKSNSNGVLFHYSVQTEEE